jgi:hypothetical protein
MTQMTATFLVLLNNGEQLCQRDDANDRNFSGFAATS